ncbi:MAG TPA: DUF3309 family protein, partial [Candidatus Thermoplasmatota archaeon]|nr:DUF3309 family protein [Candidatus Thermoplasmatota archaeon]
MPLAVAVLVGLLGLFLVGALPAWHYSRGWGYWPAGVLSFLIVLL